MTQTTLAHKKCVPGSSRNARRASTLLEQMADLARAERIRQLRDERHLTQPAVAEAVGVTLRAYQAWEATGALRWENAKRLAAFYKIDVHELWSAQVKDAAPPDPFTSANGDDPYAAALAEILDNQKRTQQKLEDIVALLTAPDAAALEDKQSSGQGSRRKRRRPKTPAGAKGH